MTAIRAKPPQRRDESRAPWRIARIALPCLNQAFERVHRVHRRDVRCLFVDLHSLR